MVSGPPIRVLQLLVSTALGGGPTQVFETLRRLSRKEFDWVIGAPADGPFFQRFAELGPVHELPLHRLSARTLLDVVRLLRTERIDVVHSHGKGAGLYGRLAAGLTRTSAVHTFHGIHADKYGPVGRAAYVALERCLSALSYAVVNVSARQAQTGDALRLWPRGRAMLIVNGIDAEQTRALARTGQRTDFGVGPRGQVIAYIARLDAVKAVEVFLDASARLLERHPDLRAVLIGGGPEERRLRDRVARAGAERAMVFAGEMPDAARVFAIADVYVSTSRGEGLPLSLLEAMACGVPVVASRIAAHEELITDGRTGLLARLDDPGDVAKKIDRVLGDQDLGRRLGAAARDVVERRYDVERTAETLAELYRRAGEAARSA